MASMRAVQVSKPGGEFELFQRESRARRQPKFLSKSRPAESRPAGMPSSRRDFPGIRIRVSRTRGDWHDSGTWFGGRAISSRERVWERDGAPDIAANVPHAGRRFQGLSEPAYDWFLHGWRLCRIHDRPCGNPYPIPDGLESVAGAPLFCAGRTTFSALKSSVWQHR